MNRNHHCFIPENDEQLRLFRISSDIPGTLVTNAAESVKISNITVELCAPGKYLAAVYDQTWYAGNIVECDKEKEDVPVNFMRAAGATVSFQWLRKKDEYWVSTEHVLYILFACTSVHHYRFDDDTTAETKISIQKNLQRYTFNDFMFDFLCKPNTC